MNIESVFQSSLSSAFLLPFALFVLTFSFLSLLPSALASGFRVRSAFRKLPFLLSLSVLLALCLMFPLAYSLRLSTSLSSFGFCRFLYSPQLSPWLSSLRLGSPLAPLCFRSVSLASCLISPPAYSLPLSFPLSSFGFLRRFLYSLPLSLPFSFLRLFPSASSLCFRFDLPLSAFSFVLSDFCFFSVCLLSFGFRFILQTTGCRHCRLVGSIAPSHSPLFRLYFV